MQPSNPSMRQRKSRRSLHYEVEVNGARRRVELRFVTVVLADVSGKSADPLPPVSDRKLLRVDRDSFDACIAALRPRVRFQVPNTLSGEGNLSVEITFERMDDFSPRGVIRQVHALQWLLELREGENLPSEIPQSGQGREEARLRDQVRQDIDLRLDEQLSTIMHHPSFQQLEASWRGLQRLVTQTETDDLLSIKLLNLSKDELKKTLRRYKGTTWDQSPLFKRLFDEGFGSAGGEPVGCIVADFQFDHEPGDVEALRELAKIGSACHAPILTGAAPTVMQMESWQELNNPRDLSKIFGTPEYSSWRALRESDDSRYLALTLPRFLARAPYGEDGSAADTYAFREEIEGVNHHRLLWANAAYLLAENIHRSFSIHGWCSRITGLQSGGAVEGLPRVRLPSDPGVSGRMLCVSEVRIDDRRERELARIGLIALVAWGDTGMAVFQSANTLNKPAEYENPDATANAALGARLPYVLVTGRFAHYLKAIARDVLDGLPDREHAQAWIDRWLADYVTDPLSPAAFSQSPRPLERAEVTVEGPESGSRTLRFFIVPAP